VFIVLLIFHDKNLDQFEGTM